MRWEEKRLSRERERGGDKLCYHSHSMGKWSFISIACLRTCLLNLFPYTRLISITSIMLISLHVLPNCLGCTLLFGLLS